MLPAHDSEEPHGLTTILRDTDTTLKALQQARQEIRSLVECGRMRPVWHPACPFLSKDEELLRRLDSVVNSLNDMLNELVKKQTELLLNAKSASPFACPAELQNTIDHFEQLCNHASKKNWKDFLSVYQRAPDGALLCSELCKTVDTLTSCAGRKLDQSATRIANRVAYPGTLAWRTEYDNYINEYFNIWRKAEHLLQCQLDEVLSERKAQEIHHDAGLATAIESQLTLHLNDLRGAMARSTGILKDVQAVRMRETTGVEVVQQLWRFTHQQLSVLYRSCPQLDEVDKLLARIWARDFPSSNFWLEAMESARRAELIAIDLYRNLYGDAEDLSILQQENPEDIRWKTADIAASGRFIDVKNARRSFSSPNTFSEFVVKRFKSVTANLGKATENVIVSGFLSPYKTDHYWGQDHSVVWLGEITLAALKSLQIQFETGYLGFLDFSGQWPMRLPPWLFDYPPECYVNRDAALTEGRSSALTLPRRSCPLGFLVLTNRVVLSQGDLLSEEAHALSQRIMKVGTLTRPILFLHILDRFCRTIRAGSNFPSPALREILFSIQAPVANDCPEYRIPPLGVLDPLETVKELLDVLEQVAVHCAKEAVVFTSFRLGGAGTFEGRQNRHPWQTIFAYCGGWRRLSNGGKVKCGQCPLFMGQNDSCDHCGKLICHQCGYCSNENKCKQCVPRQAEWPTASADGRSLSRTASIDSDSFEEQIEF